MDNTVAWMIDRRVDHLHPLMMPRIERLNERLIKLYGEGLICRLEVFEGYRHPGRQGTLGKSVTKADPWESAHQYGMAVDYARRLEKGFDWKVSSSDWGILRYEAKKVGLDVPAPGWDPGHVEAPEFRELVSVLNHARELARRPGS